MNNEAYVKEYITDSLLSLIKNSTLEKITITDIIKKAGVSRISFYRNFNSKEDILEQYLTSITDNFIKNSDINFKENDLKTYFTILFKHLYNYKDFTLNLYKSNCLYLVENQFKRLFNNRNYDYDVYKRQFYIGGIYNIYYYWLINGCKESPELLAEKLVNLLQK